MQLLLYPVTDAVGGQQSRDTFAEGFLLTRDDMDWFENHYLPDGIDDDEPRVSMMRAADVSGLPPAYVATAGFDPLRDEGEIYAARMREAGVQVVLQRHPEPDPRLRQPDRDLPQRPRRDARGRRRPAHGPRPAPAVPAPLPRPRGLPSVQRNTPRGYAILNVALAS